jgi:hypothetical protein
VRIQPFDRTRLGLTIHYLAFLRLTDLEFEALFLRTIGDNLHTSHGLFGGMSDDPNHLRRWAAHLLSLSADNKEWEAHLALRAADYLARAEEIERKAAEAQRPQKTWSSGSGPKATSTKPGAPPGNATSAAFIIFRC